MARIFVNADTDSLIIWDVINGMRQSIELLDIGDFVTVSNVQYYRTQNGVMRTTIGDGIQQVAIMDIGDMEFSITDVRKVG